MRRAIFIALTAILASTARADERPEILRVEPSLDDTLVVCRVRTSGLPDEPTIESVESGAPAAVLLTLDLTDGEGRVLSERRIECRIVLDLWDDVVLVKAGSMEWRLEDAAAVTRHFEDLRGLPVSGRRYLEPGGRYRVHVRADSSPIAPQEEARVRERVAGGSPAEDEGQSREVFIGLGSLIRFFFGGGHHGSAEGSSPWFTPEELNVEAH